MSAAPDPRVVIQAAPKDASVILNMILELAEFEKMSDQVMMTPLQLSQDLARGAVLVKLAYYAGEPAGMTLYFPVYSSWEGQVSRTLTMPIYVAQCMHMEDLYVRPKFRGRNLASLLVKALAIEAVEKQYPRINWNVLDWNMGARTFYKKINATDLTAEEGWLSYRLFGKALQDLAKADIPMPNKDKVPYTKLFGQPGTKEI